ncbi:MAG: site-2 protease family protein [Elusimicrobia bacterium]|nr:site-2 protease family protein [Elusimicrobiota bacterium]
MSLAFLQSALAVVVTLGLVILCHEFGHFIVCRLLGVRVERFAFGFGPELIGWTGRLKTRFSLHAIPLGGFVKPAGEDISECSGAKDEYYGQNWHRRLAIVFAGPTMNYVLAWALFTGVVYFQGIPEAGTAPVIGNLVSGFPADKGGVLIGDEVTAVAGLRVDSWETLAKAIHASPGKELELSVKRASGIVRVRVLPRKDDATGRGVVGIMPQPVYREVGPVEAVVEGAKQCAHLTAFTIQTIGSKLLKREKPDLAGPVGIAQMVSRAAHSSFEDLVFLIGLISVAIGFFNLLPIPLLDGGHAVLYLWEGVSGRKLTSNTVNAANSVGIFFLLFLLVFATYNDFSRIYRERAARKAAVSQPKQP